MDQNIVSVKASPKDVFLHLASIVALYGCTISFLVLVFQIINILIPDATVNYYGLLSAENIARRAIAGVAVFCPMFLISLRMLSRSYAEDESRRRVHIRKWLLYFTLFITAFVMAGDLISLIYNFLDGDLTLKFILKVCCVFLVAFVIFWSYQRELKDQKDSKVKYAGIIVSLTVLASIVVGVFVAGSPFEKRMQKIDNQRVYDLSMIQSFIVEYWQSKGKLPDNLSMLNDNLRDIVVPKDPETKAEYGYGTKGDKTFVLCAVFSAKTGGEQSSAVTQYSGMFENATWNHDVGTSCFERTIDKDFFQKDINAIKAGPTL